MLGPRAPADEERKLRPCLQWVKHGSSEHVRCASALPLNADDLDSARTVREGP